MSSVVEQKHSLPLIMAIAWDVSALHDVTHSEVESYEDPFLRLVFPKS